MDMEKMLNIMMAAQRAAFLTQVQNARMQAAATLMASPKVNGNLSFETQAAQAVGMLQELLDADYDVFGLDDIAFLDGEDNDPEDDDLPTISMHELDPDLSREIGQIIEAGHFGKPVLTPEMMNRIGASIAKAEAEKRAQGGSVFQFPQQHTANEA